MARKAANGQTAPEFVLADGEQLDAVIEAALERTTRGEVADLRDRKYAVAADVVEAATLSPADGTEILYVGRPRRGLPPVEWVPTLRTDVRAIGSHTFRFARAFRGGLSAPALAALESAFGRHDLEAYLASVPPTATPIALEAAAHVVDPGRRTRVYHFRHKGRWFAAWREDGPAPRAAPPGPPLGGQAYPKINVT